MEYIYRTSSPLVIYIQELTGQIVRKLEKPFYKKGFHVSLLLLSFGFIFIYFYKLGNFGLFNVDEPFYAEIAREMNESGNWLVPRFNYKVIYDKPIFLFWMQILSMKFFGINEFSTRFPSTITAVTCSVFLFYIIKKLYGSIPALLSVLILMTSLGFAVYSRLVMTDMALTSFIACSIISFFLGYNKVCTSPRPIRTPNIWYVLGFIFLAFGVLTKGPVAIVIVGGVLFPFFLFIRKSNYFTKSTCFYLGFILFLFLVFPWYLAVHEATGGEFTRTFFGLHNFQRFTSVVANHKAPLFFYLPVISIGFLPWSFFLPQSIYSLIKENRKNLLRSPKEQFQWLSLWWALFVFIFFTISQTKLMSYILPLFPPLSVLVALWLSSVLNGETNKRAFVIGLSVLVLPLLLSSIIVTPMWFNLEILPQKIIEGLAKVESYVDLSTIILLAICTTIGLTLAWFSSKRSIRFSILTLLSTFLFAYFSVVQLILPMIDRNAELQLELRTFTNDIKKENAELITLDAYKPGFVFYLGKKVHEVKTLDQLLEKVGEKKKYAFVTDKNHFKEMPRDKIHLCDWNIKDKYMYFTNYPLKSSCNAPSK